MTHVCEFRVPSKDAADEKATERFVKWATEEAKKLHPGQDPSPTIEERTDEATGAVTKVVCFLGLHAPSDDDDDEKPATVRRASADRAARANRTAAEPPAPSGGRIVRGEGGQAAGRDA